MGRPLVPTQSMPTFGFDNSGLFQSARNTYARAHELISKERLRERELQPFGALSPSMQPSDDVHALSLSPRSRNAQTLAPNGQAEGVFARGIKRTTSVPEAEDNEGEATDTDEPAEAAQPRPQVDLPNVSTDFPPVFQSAGITHPELFQPGSMGPPPVPGRVTRGLPARGGPVPGARPGLSKAASAPVGKLGDAFAWGMDLDDAGDADGFDVSEWAQSEQF